MSKSFFVVQKESNANNLEIRTIFNRTPTNSVRIMYVQNSDGVILYYNLPLL